ncbi:DUF5805 domain-containing protein [Halovivax limisalsi]|uniref:DUF5805 domain-containing protein n=1 Tax=Halovivax limisalsi TaxID=1453760 RepID=UPI001FFCA12E|nr:DUF5805 domain-containing protein [Halovivax limisalsi]
MSADDRVAVKTYVPRYQKERWEEDATEMEMSTSEFVRTMVQAGRSDIVVPGTELSGEKSRSSDEPSDTPSEPPNGSDGSADFETRITDVLEEQGSLDWDELVDALVDDVEADLEAALQSLQADNAVMYSGRAGGYTLIDDE